ncbi:MAG: hypothetical protein NTU86_06125 [Burkholderiales bacterium]|nr:hypothetical protein [Burkholderiales bacterium]
MTTDSSTATSVCPASLGWYCLRTALFASIPTLTGLSVLLVTSYFQPLEPGTGSVKLPMPDAWELFGNVVFAPVTETALLVAVLLLLARTPLSATLKALLCALGFGVLHGVLQGWFKFPMAAWGFYFFAQAFQVWRGVSLPKAVLAALVPHVIVNATVMAALAAYSL